MKIIFFLCAMLISFSVFSQHEGDTVYQRCPVAIKDPATGNNYFIAHQAATVKAYRNHGNFIVVIEQKGQFFTMFFDNKRLSTKGKYNISSDVKAKYSFKSGESVAYIDVSSGKVETSYDKITKLWHIIVTGLISNMGGTGVSNFNASADFFIL
jgi:hypothetical protein